MRTRRCDPGVRTGRLSKARQFHEAAAGVVALADEAGDVRDAVATLLVHAGIAAADAVCCARLGEHSASDKHHDALELLRRADAGLARHLRVLLGVKNASGYSHVPASADELKAAQRAADALLAAAERA